MDDVVKQAMAKWPDVPAVYGWLALDRRGKWLIKGESIPNHRVTEFIARNYAHDAEGRWFFQNGPQRVFAELRYTPLIYRLADSNEIASLRMQTHTAKDVASLEGAWIDDEGGLLFRTEHGPGALDDRDMDRILPCLTDRLGVSLTDDELISAVDRLQAGEAAPQLYFSYLGRAVQLLPINAADVPVRLGFIRHPLPPPGHEVC